MSALATVRTTDAESVSFVCITSSTRRTAPEGAAQRFFWLSEVQTTSQISQIVRDRTRSYEIVWIVWIVLDRAPIH